MLQFVYCNCIVQADASSILPSSQSEHFLYPSVWEFRVFPKQNASHVSERVTCKLLITAGRTELAQQHFDHDCPRSYCKFRSTGLPIGYSVIVALTRLPVRYSVIVALTYLPIGYSVMVVTFCICVCACVHVCVHACLLPGVQCSIPPILRVSQCNGVAKSSHSW